MSDFVFECPLCGKALDCDDNLENQVVRCPECGGEIVPTRPTGQTARPPVPPARQFQSGGGRPGRQMIAPFKRPVLTVVFNAVGVVHILVGILFGVLGAIEHQPLAVIYGAAIAAASVFPFGIAQIVYYIARISYNSERTVDLLNRK